MIALLKNVGLQVSLDKKRIQDAMKDLRDSILFLHISTTNAPVNPRFYDGTPNYQGWLIF